MKSKEFVMVILFQRNLSRISSYSAWKPSLKPDFQEINEVTNCFDIESFQFADFITFLNNRQGFEAFWSFHSLSLSFFAFHLDYVDPIWKKV